MSTLVPSVRRSLLILVLVLMMATAVLWPLYEHMKWRAAYAKKKPCFETISVDMPSPNGAIVVRSSRMTCGPVSTSFVTLRDASTTSVDRDNDWVLKVTGECPVRLIWQDDSNLSLVYHTCPTGKLQEGRSAWRGVHIAEVEVGADGRRSPILPSETAAPVAGTSSAPAMAEPAPAGNAPAQAPPAANQPASTDQPAQTSPAPNN